MPGRIASDALMGDGDGFRVIRSNRLIIGRSIDSNHPIDHRRDRNPFVGDTPPLHPRLRAGNEHPRLDCQDPLRARHHLPWVPRIHRPVRILGYTVVVHKVRSSKSIDPPTSEHTRVRQRFQSAQVT